MVISESRIKQRLLDTKYCVVIDMQLFLHTLDAVPSDNTFLKVCKRNKREIKKDTTCVGRWCFHMNKISTEFTL